MMTSVKSLNPFSGYLLVGLLAIELALLLAYLGSIAVSGNPYPAVDFNGQATLPSLLQALHFLVIACLILWILGQPRSRFPYPSRPFLIAFAILLFYATIDEIFKVHLHLDVILQGRKNWKWLYIGSFTALMAWQYRNFVILWQQYQRETILTFIGIAVFILGGYGSEIFSDLLAAQNPDGAIATVQLLGVSIEQWRIAYEELSELVGENLILYACLQFISKH